MQKGNYEGGRPSLWLKAAEGEQERLVEEEPDVYFAPPYVGQNGWVGVYLDGRRLAWKEIERLIARSYRLIAPKKLAALVEEPGA